MGDPRVLSYSECEALLRAGVAGRVALSTPTGPHILPVNYSVVGGAVIIRTTPSGLLGTYGRDATLAFEVDEFDYPNQRGWSVLVRGRSDVVDDHHELTHIRSVWPPRPWADGQRSLFVRIHPTELSGRQLGIGWDPMGQRAARGVV